MAAVVLCVCKWRRGSPQCSFVPRANARKIGDGHSLADASLNDQGREVQLKTIAQEQILNPDWSDTIVFQSQMLEMSGSDFIGYDFLSCSVVHEKTMNWEPADDYGKSTSSSTEWSIRNEMIPEYNMLAQLSSEGSGAWELANDVATGLAQLLEANVNLKQGVSATSVEYSRCLADGGCGEISFSGDEGAIRHYTTGRQTEAMQTELKVLMDRSFIKSVDNTVDETRDVMNADTVTGGQLVSSLFVHQGVSELSTVTTSTTVSFALKDSSDGDFFNIRVLTVSTPPLD